MIMVEILDYRAIEVPGSGPTSNRDFPVKSTLSPDPIIEEKGYRGTWFNK